MVISKTVYQIRSIDALYVHMTMTDLKFPSNVNLEIARYIVDYGMPTQISYIELVKKSRTDITQDELMDIKKCLSSFTKTDISNNSSYDLVSLWQASRNYKMGGIYSGV